MEGDRESRPFVKTEHSEFGGWFSPDGRWVLYISDKSGVDQAYVKPFPGPGGGRLVSNDEAYWGWWRTQSEVLLMHRDGWVRAVDVSIANGTIRAGVPKTLVHLGPPTVGEPTHDGSRFVIAVVPEQHSTGQLTLLVNWPLCLADR